MDFDGPGIYAPWWHVTTLILGGFVWLLGIALMLAVLFFLIRFLLVATKAAQLYVNQNAPAEPARPSKPAATAPAATASTTATTPSAATKPAAKPRTPRKPTA